MNKHVDFTGRLQFLGAVIVCIIAVLLGRAGYLQVYDGELYARLAEGNRIRIIPAEAARGTFFDRNGEVLVTNRPGFAVSLLPLTEQISPEVIARVAALIHIPVEEIQRKIDAHVGFDPIRIKNDVTPDIVSIIEEQKNNYPGVVIEVLPFRDYILVEQAAHVFGYVSEISEEELEKRKDEGYKSGYIVGKFGLERIYDKEIRGVNGGEQVEVDVSGRPIQILGRKSPVPGNDLVLTIDKHIQETAERAVDDQLKLVQAHAAAAVVMNPQTGGGTRRGCTARHCARTRGGSGGHEPADGRGAGDGQSSRIQSESLCGRNLNTELECAEQQSISSDGQQGDHRGISAWIDF